MLNPKNPHYIDRVDPATGRIQWATYRYARISRLLYWGQYDVAQWRNSTQIETVAAPIPNR